MTNVNENKRRTVSACRLTVLRPYSVFRVSVSAEPEEAEDVEEEIDEVQIEGEGTEDGDAAG